MKHFFFYSLIAVLALQASCSEYDLGYTPEQIGYNITFRKDFGDYDMANDFNLAQRGQVTVTPTACPEVCIYSKSATGWQLVAKYDDVTGTRDLGFDIPKGTKEILVANGSQTQNTTIGGSVFFSGTRAGVFDAQDGDVSAILNEGIRYTYLYYDRSTALEYRNVLPEAKDNRNNVKVQNDFSLVSTGEFIVYPTYWDCIAESEIGIYYYKEDGSIASKPLFYNHKRNESVQFKDGEGNWVTYHERPIWSAGWTSAWPFLRMWDNNGALNDVGRGKEVKEYRSKGIIVNLPIGTKFGFYYTPWYIVDRSSTKFAYHRDNISGDRIDSPIEGWTGDKWTNNYGVWMEGKEDRIFSSTDDNTYYYVPLDKNKSKNFKIAPFATYFDEKGDLNICLEDMDHFTGRSMATSEVDFDYNDVQFKIYGSLPEVLNNKSQSWLLPFEDLGGSFDWDFNDVILKMDYVSGQSTATITPIAAGGTLHSEVFFNDTDDESKAQNLGEIHVLLGAEPVGENELYEPINASHRGTPGTVKTVNITDPTTFSIANAQSVANSSVNGASTKSMVGAYIVTKGNNGMSTIAYNGMGKAPAMLVLPAIYEIGSTNYEWAWPVENKDIRSAYGELGHSFDEWVADHTKAQDWYKYPTGGTVEERSASSSINTLVPSPEYDMDDYGTIISLPSKNSEGVYAFPASLFSGATDASVTVVLKGVKKNALYAYDGSAYSDAIGNWSRLNGSGSITVMGNNASGSGEGSVNYEGMYQITLGSSDLSTIAVAGQWVVSAGEDTQILYIAYKNSTNGGTPSDPQAGQTEEPVSSNDPANGSEPVLAPIR